LYKNEAKNQTVQRDAKTIVQTLLNTTTQVVKIRRHKSVFNPLIYMDLFDPRFVGRNPPQKWRENRRRNFAQKVPQKLKKIYFHVTQGASFQIKSLVGVSCSIVTVWLPYGRWKSIWITHLGRASLPTSGVTQIKEDT
jgi:hypothetical protein